MITIINCYAPHLEITQKKPEETQKFYNQLENTVKKLQNKSSLMIIGGDLNACVGKKREEEECIGRYSKGIRNENGEKLIEFCKMNEMLLTNTCFSHKQSHLTTWQQTRINKNEEVKHVRKVLDYIMIESQYRHILRNARSYQGTKTSSDHRIVITNLQIDWQEVHKKKNVKSKNKSKRYDTQKLISDTKVLNTYKQTVDDNINNKANRKWNNVIEAMKEAAKSVLGVQKSNKRKETMTRR